MDYNPFSLTGKTILVTGASSGIGRATAIACSRMGARIILSGRNAKELAKTELLLEQSFVDDAHLIVQADLSMDEDIDVLIRECPNLDGIVSNAGIMKLTPIQFVSDLEVSRIHRVNIVAPMLLLKGLLRKKKVNKGCSIVFTSSVAGVYRVSPGNAIYASSKCGLDAYMRTAALELASKGIRCNSVNPGMVRTELLKSGQFTRDDLEREKCNYPLGKFATADDIANAIVFLLSDASGCITGTALKIDGGMTLM